MTNPVEFEPRKLFYGIILITFSYMIFFLLTTEILDSRIKEIPRFMGGASAIYFLFLSRSCFSQFITLYSFLVCEIFMVFNMLEIDIAILVAICIACPFLVCSFFIGEKRSLDKYFLQWFSILITSKIFMSPDMGILFVIEILFLFLFGFRYRENREQHKMGFFLYFTLLPCVYIYSSWVNIVQVIVLAAAGAGGVQMMVLSKTEKQEKLAFVVYLLSNIILGFIYRKEGETFPIITIYFILVIFFFYIYLFLIAQIKNQTVSSVFSESKITLRGVILPIFYLLNFLFWNDSPTINLMITSLVIHLLVLLLLKKILSKEDELEVK